MNISSGKYFYICCRQIEGYSKFHKKPFIKGFLHPDSLSCGDVASVAVIINCIRGMSTEINFSEKAQYKGGGRDW